VGSIGQGKRRKVWRGTIRRSPLRSVKVVEVPEIHLLGHLKQSLKYYFFWGSIWMNIWEE
jgi:hypothetical protein